MKNKILKLAKRLETFRLEDIESIMGDGIESVLQELVKDGQLNLVGEIYSYKAEQKSPLPFCFKFHSQEKIEMITKCFCAGVKSKQASFLLDIGDATMQNFYKHFRQMIYERQLNALKTHFEHEPKIPKMRRFYDIPVYFYLYDDELYVADKQLKTKRKKLPHTKEESLRIKVLYSRLCRSINHSQMKQYLAQHVAEHIWRYGKDYYILSLTK
ncbi:MAG: hypothetical protein SPL70_00430 [Cyanobacteriota bacterium]|nr:hypothetical protein [Cyanobacteriota bacterium]MDY6359553.1 hypothetical protein [Cyanobacteriota bacterium]MDY6382357.1 hypothetical protein [Cyanobacteriota bacterium]